MGENGAGKSTLIKVLTGVEEFETGEIMIDGCDHTIINRSPQEAQSRGISTVYQEVNLCPNLTVAENLFIGREPRKAGLIDWKTMNKRAAKLLQDLDIHADVTQTIDNYSIAIQQMIAIARAVDMSAKVLILDEPTSSLDDGEVEKLFKLMLRLKGEGVGIIFVTHFLEQVYAVCDKITVLRNGQLVGEFTTAELPRVQLVAKMMGKDFDDLADIKGDHKVLEKFEPVIEAEQVGRKLGVASMETKREVQKSLMPEKFNGEGIIDVLGRQRSTTKLEAAIRLLGEDAFWSTEAQVKTMYQAVRNMTRISKLQAAGYIWKVSHANDIKFYAPSDLMPSYIAADKKKAADDKDREYRVMCTQVEKARKELEKCEKDVSVKTDRMTEAQKKYDAAVDRLNIAQNDFAKLEDVKDDYINNRKTEDESKRYYAQVNDTKREMDRSLDDSDRKKKRLQETEKELKLACEKAEERKIYLESVQKTADEETKKRAKELKIKWTAFFFKYSFDDEVFESAVSIFSREELRYIEETLKEAHDSASMLAVGDNNVIRAYTGGKYTAVITYEDRHIISIQSM
jgi:ABC-type multidrug transport system ATPase subunit